MAIVEKGTPFEEQIDVDEQRNVEVFRVPAHNDVEGADFYHDFKMVSIWYCDGSIFAGQSPLLQKTVKRWT